MLITEVREEESKVVVLPCFQCFALLVRRPHFI